MKELFCQLTGIEPAPFLKREVLDDISEGRCVLCHQEQDVKKNYCLIGRHRIVGESEKIKWVELAIERTTKYAYQGAYIAICTRCYRKYKLLEFLTWICVLPLGIAFLLTFIALPLQCAGQHLEESDFFVALWGGSWVLGFIGLGLHYIPQAYCDSDHYSRKIIEVNKILPEYGVPDLKGSTYRELVDEESLREIVDSKL